MKTNNIFIILLAMILLPMYTGCGSSEEFKKTPVDELIKEMNAEPTFTILLYDMDVEGNFSKTYRHQYQIITTKDSVPETRTTDWYEVPKSFFEKHIDDMGMEIASKTEDGKVTKGVAPPGYSNYVGNPQYGQWQTGSNGSSFWEFYGKYAMMSSLFNMMTYPVYRNSYMDYRDNYYGRNAYYGSTSASGQRMYGTGSTYTNSTNTSSKWNTKASNSTFRDKVRSRVSKSSSGSDRISRSNTRSSSGSSYRSRSRGFGK